MLNPAKSKDLLVEAQALAKLTFNLISLRPESLTNTSVLLEVLRFNAKREVPLVGLEEER